MEVTKGTKQSRAVGLDLVEECSLGWKRADWDGGWQISHAEILLCGGDKRHYGKLVLKIFVVIDILPTCR